MIPIGRPQITDADRSAVSQALATGQLVQGEQVAAFERELASVIGTSHVVAVSSGTAALMTSLAAVGVGHGDMAVVAAYSWIATANVVELAGAEPIFVDIDPSTLCMDPHHLETTLSQLRTDGRLARVKAIIPVHVFGYIAPMAEILAIAHDFGVPVIEDAACALGADLGGRQAGTFGLVGCFSFHPLKPITTGEGGALATDDAGIAEFARAYRNHGQDFRHPEGRFVMAGPNLRMTDFQAALGRSQLSRLPDLLDERRALVERYQLILSALPLRFQAHESGRTTCQAFTILLDDPTTRDSLLGSLEEEGIGAGPGTIAMPFVGHLQQRYRTVRGALPITSAVEASAVTLPLFNGLSHDEQDRVAEVIRAAMTASASQRVRSR